jgi:hypothetical protein
VNRKILAALAALVLMFTAGTAAAAPSRSGGTSSGTSSGGRTTRSPTVTSRTLTTRPTTATTGRSTSSPSKPSTAVTTQGRTTRAPARTGTKVVASTVRNTVQPTAGSINISRDTVAGGTSYRVPGTSYTYRYSASTYSGYYSRYAGGYPPVGTPLYWRLWNDPFYYPNYTTIGSPWYGHPTPVGYRLDDGQLIRSSRPFPWVTVLVWLAIIALVVALAVVAVRRALAAKANRPYDL